jgi:hypothetical protein
MTSDGRVDGFIIYHFAWSGQEAIVPMETRVASAYMLPFVSPPFGSTGIAIANTGAGNVDVSVGMQVGGNYIGLGTLALPARGHTSFVLDQKFPFSTWLPDIIEFRAPAAAQISVVGLIFDPLGHTTALPVLTDATPFSGSVAQIAAGAGIATSIALLNMGSTGTNLHVQFRADDGGPLSLDGGVTGFGCSPSVGSFSSFDRAVGPGVYCGVTAVRGAMNSQAVGSAEVTTDGPTIGWVVYTLPPNEVFVPLETRTASSFVLPYDNTSAVVTGVAVANVDAQAALIPVTIRDEAGAPVFSGELDLAAQGHTSFVLAQRFPASANIRGTMEFKTPVAGRISVLGLRATPAGTVSSIPVLVP